jgi:hypothetical protein
VFFTDNGIMKIRSRSFRTIVSIFNLALIISLGIGLLPQSQLPAQEGPGYTSIYQASSKNLPSYGKSPKNSDPIVTLPVITDPVVTEPAVIEPAVTEPAVTEPAVTEPIVTDPLLTDPAVLNPVFTDTPVFEVNAFGVKGDGTTSNDAALASMLAEIPAGSTVNFEAGKIYVVTAPILLTKALNLDLRGATVIAQNSASAFLVKSDNVIIRNGVLDLNYTTHNGIKASGRKEAYVGVTASAASGSNTLTVNTVPSELSKTKYITIAGLAGYFKVTAVSGNQLTLDKPVKAAVSNSALSWYKPFSNLYFQGLNIKDLIPTALNLEGGIYLTRCENVHIDQCTFSNIFNPGDTGDIDHSPSIKFNDCYNIEVNDIVTSNGGVGINLWNVLNASVNRVSMINMADNGFYLQEYSDNISVDNFTIDGVEEGVVFDTVDMAGTADGIPTIKVSNGVIRGATTHGFSLRQGSDFYVNNVKFTECWNNIGQSSSYAGISDAVFDNITCLNTLSHYPAYLGNDKNLTFNNLTLQGFSSEVEDGRIKPSDGMTIRSGCQNIQIYGLNIIGDNLNLRNGIVIHDATSNILIEGNISGYTGYNILNESSGINIVSRITGSV